MLKVRIFFDDLIDGETGCQKIENITDANPHVSNTRATPALKRIDSDPLALEFHDLLLFPVNDPGNSPRLAQKKRAMIQFIIDYGEELWKGQLRGMSSLCRNMRKTPH
jgi:hypothetical protein